MIKVLVEGPREGMMMYRLQGGGGEMCER